MSLEKRQLIEREVRRLCLKTGIAMLTLAGFAGVPERTWREWQARRNQETRHNGHIPREHWLTPAETEAIVAYCQSRMKLGYRVLCWQMVDEDVAAASPSSVYNVLKRSGLTKKWAELAEEKKKGFDQPQGVHEHWHIDFSYIRIDGAFYYFISVLDGYSRMILGWDLCRNMDGLNAEILISRTHERHPEARPRIISDNGGQFVSKDFRDLIMLLELEQTFTAPAHPQSNGKLERFHRTFKTEHVRQAAYFGYEDAKARMGRWIKYYNEKRLHGSIYYLSPLDVFEGRTYIRLAERRQKLHSAYIQRQSYWQNQNAGL
ncbi:DDE-type integrase/transposase/recombinase [Leadbettera azotonutricia]|nr:DDE-type integrase/transposase/recombinase [Leadbettera azotonutricia]AEF81422.1 transposase [Leadbettera azotonutricia ZAS-9]AEF82569.1 transposase [Leadbettera azotonutricia ZAS-9]AEF83004.1 transposase [Leadbettera azotonutricia ZAS-9]